MASEADASEIEASPLADAAPVEEIQAFSESTPKEEEPAKEEVTDEAERDNSVKGGAIENAAEETNNNPEPESEEVEDSDTSPKITEGESTNDVPVEGGENNEERAQDEVEENVANVEPESNEDDSTPKITVDDIKTAPIDFRFPTTNQAKHCFTRYNEYHKCVKEKGEDQPDCEKYARWYRSLCPGEWIERWNEQRQNGTFPGRY